MKSINHSSAIGNTTALEQLGARVTRYGLAVVLIWIGVLKFTSYEAEGIKPLVEHSPFLSWTYSVMSVSGVSSVLGVIEILSGVLIACRSFSAKASLTGSCMGIFTFLITLTLLLSTPGIIQTGYSFPFISPMPGQFILKDIVLLGASAWTAAEAWTAAITAPAL